MVVEYLVNVFKAEKKPWELMLLGFLYCSIAIFLGNWIFSTHLSMVVILLTVIAALPLFYDSIRYEEQKDISIDDEVKLLKEHEKLFLAMSFLFVGFIIGFSFWYIVLPRETVENVFLAQTQTIAAINAPTGNFKSQVNIFSIIFLNNVKVLLFCVFFSFLYGAGALFILTWNASVVGTAIGNFFRTEIAKFSLAFGFTSLYYYFRAYSLSILRYLIHGIPEICAYLIAGLAGGIISTAIVRHDFTTKNFERVIIDTADLLIISLLMLFVAALIEVFVTPLFF
ncbi:MAG: stage II sporulation protein M [Candidatus Woesearchaeota archaeon]